MNNVNINILFFDGGTRSINSNKINLLGVNKSYPDIAVKQLTKDMLNIPVLNILLAINVNKIKEDSPCSVHPNEYQIQLRFENEANGKYVNLDTFNVCPDSKGQNSFRSIYNKHVTYQFRNIPVAKSLNEENFYVVKVLIKSLTGSDSHWTVQAIQPINLVIK